MRKLYKKAHFMKFECSTSSIARAKYLQIIVYHPHHYDDDSGNDLISMLINIITIVGSTLTQGLSSLSLSVYMLIIINY